MMKGCINAKKIRKLDVFVSLYSKCRNTNLGINSEKVRIDNLRSVNSTR